MQALASLLAAALALAVLSAVSAEDTKAVTDPQPPAEDKKTDKRGLASLAYGIPLSELGHGVPVMLSAGLGHATPLLLSGLHAGHAILIAAPGHAGGYSLSGLQGLAQGQGPQTVVITRAVPYSIPQPVPVTVTRHVPYPVKVAVPYLVDRPFEVPVPKPYPVELRRPVAVPVEKPYPVEVKVPVKIPVPAPYPVEISKPYKVAVEVPRPYKVPVKVPAVFVKDHHHHHHHLHSDEERYSGQPAESYSPPAEEHRAPGVRDEEYRGDDVRYARFEQGASARTPTIHDSNASV